MRYLLIYFLFIVLLLNHALNNSDYVGSNDHLFIIILSGVRLSSLGYLVNIGLLYQPKMIDDDDDCGAIGGMKIGRENRSTRRKPSPVPLCPPQIPHKLTRARTRASAMGSQ
jgi:hypothetical protein